MKRSSLLLGILTCAIGLLAHTAADAHAKRGGGAGAVITVTAQNAPTGYALGRVINKTSGKGSSHLLYLYPGTQDSVTNAHKSANSSDVIELTFWPEPDNFVGDPGTPIDTSVTVLPGQSRISVTLARDASGTLSFGAIMVQ